MAQSSFDQHAFMLDFHRQHTGLYTQVLSRFLDTEKRTPYEFLAQQTSHLGEHAQVVELGCADGHMLACMAEVTPARLVGVDISPEELALAQKSLGNRATLLCEDAANLSLPDNSVDMVVSHGSLGVMSPIEAVFKEIARVLKPGGELRYVVNYPQEGGWVFDVFMEEIRRARKKEKLTGFLFGDMRVYNQEGLEDLAAITKLLYSDMPSKELYFICQETPEVMIDLLTCYYECFLLKEKTLAKMRLQVLEKWRKKMKDDMLFCLFGMRYFGCKKVSA